MNETVKYYVDKVWIEGKVWMGYQAYMVCAEHIEADTLEHLREQLNTGLAEGTLGTGDFEHITGVTAIVYCERIIEYNGRNYTNIEWVDTVALGSGEEELAEREEEVLEALFY